jgi:hypothetical protein
MTRASWELARDLIIACALLAGYAWLAALSARVRALHRRLATQVCRDTSRDEQRNRSKEDGRWIPCRDPIGRARSVIVISDRSGVVMISPPGEVAVFSDEQTAKLCAALHDASIERTAHP